MRTLVAVLLAAGVASAAVPPQPTSKTFDVSELIGADGPFPTADDLRAVVVAFYGDWSEGCGIRKEVEGGKLTVDGYESSHRRVEAFLNKLHDLKRRRNTQVTVECLIFTTDKGTGGAMLLPKDGDGPVMLSGKETALTNALVRHKKAEGNLDVLSRPTLTLTHGTEGFVRVGQQFPEVVAKCAKPDGGVVPVVQVADVGLSTRLTATVQDGEKVKLTGSVSNSEVVKDEKVRVTHLGEFRVDELASGGTAVARIPTVAGGTEMYLMMTVTSVGPARKAEQKEVLPPIILPTVELPPMPQAEKPARGFFGPSVKLNIKPHDLDPIPAAEIGERSLRPPLRNVWDDLGPLKPLPSHPQLFSFYDGWIGGQ